ncbi:MAG TPA: Na+-transporting NADH:ubiquinone oxidoreductase subunit D, partial [Lachnospiraceae bacterium]|nr:Na+-transporting NADH:ubiquinone oxidoreductase subunit D [Lachnospiraceae bacterium]
MSELYNISSSPHVRAKDSTSRIMLLVLIALLPATLFGVYNFGLPALWNIIVTTATAVLTEFIYEKLMHKKVTIGDYSAAVTGLLLALNLPAEAPVWMGALGSVFAILVVKQLFGGLGQNFMNPALGARCFLLISFTGRMTSFAYDGVTMATPLAQMRADGNLSGVNTFDMLIGRIPGTIGETSVIAIMIGAIILLLFGVIDLRIPGTYLVTFVIFISLFGGRGFDYAYISAHLAGGGLMLGAFF